MMTYDGTGAIPRIPVQGPADTSAARVRTQHPHHARTLDDLAGLPRLDLTGGQERQGPVGVFRGDHREHADAHVERALHFRALDPAPGLYEIEDRLRPPGGPVDDRIRVVGQYPGQVARDAAAGDV